MSALLAVLLLAAPAERVDVKVTVSDVEFRDVEDLEKWLGQHSEVVSAESRSFENGEATFRVTSKVAAKPLADRFGTSTFHKRKVVVTQVSDAAISLRFEKAGKR